jgi:hypothetical protein
MTGQFTAGHRAIGHHSQVVRQRSAKPLFSGSNPDGASNLEPPSSYELGGYSVLWTCFLFIVIELPAYVLLERVWALRNR